MAVSFIGKGTFSSSTGDISAVPVHTSTLTGDFMLLCVETANQAVSTPSGWTEAPGSPIGIGTGGGAGAVGLSVYYKFATADGDATVNRPAISDAGNHVTANVLTFRGVDSTNPFNAYQNGSKSTASPSGSCPAVTTTDPMCMIVNIVGLNHDANSTDVTSSWSNSNLASITECHDQTSSTADGGGFSAAYGVKNTAGDTGDTTLSMLNQVCVYLTLALSPVIQSGSVDLDIGTLITVEGDFIKVSQNNLFFGMNF